MCSLRTSTTRRARARRLFAGALCAGGALSAAMLIAAPAEAAAQTFRICVVDEDEFQIKNVQMFLSPGPGQFVPIEQVRQEEGQGCAGDKHAWFFVVTNALDTPGNRAIVEFKFKTDDGSGAGGPQIDSTVALSLRLLALNKIGQPDNRVEVWIPASVPETVGPGYLDTLEQMSKPRQVQKLMHAAIVYDRLRDLYGPRSDVTRRAAVILMNAATELTAQDRASESLYEVPDFVVKAIEDSLGRQNYFERLVRRFEESRSAPVIKADHLIRELVRTGQCGAARGVLTTISSYVGDEIYLLKEARVPLTHLEDLNAKIDRDCEATG